MENLKSPKYKYLVYTFIGEVKVYVLNYSRATGFNFDLVREQATRFSEAEAHNLTYLAARNRSNKLYLEKY